MVLVLGVWLASDDQARGTTLPQQAASKGHRNAKWELQKSGVVEELRHDQSLLTAPQP